MLILLIWKSESRRWSFASMGSPAAFLHADSDIPLLSLPAELLTCVYCSLPSLLDVFILSSSCHLLRDVWLKNASTIYHQVGPRSIPCERYARSLLADQKGTISADIVLRAEDVLRIVKNAHTVEKHVYQYEIQINWKVRGRDRRAENYDEVTGLRKRHIPLTRTERPRFIRSYYQLWGMMKLRSPAERQLRLDSLTLKQLYRLHETSKIPGSIGREEDVGPPPTSPITDHRSIHQMRPSLERRALRDMIWKHIEDIYPSTHDDNEPPETETDGLYFGFGTYTVMWDHYQKILKEIVCCYRRKEPPFLLYHDWEQWDDSSDEEV